MCDSSSEEFPLAHYLTNVYVYEEAGEIRVHAKWFVPDRVTAGIATGDYHNVVARTPAGWRIASVDVRVRSFPGGVPRIEVAEQR